MPRRGAAQPSSTNQTGVQNAVYASHSGKVAPAKSNQVLYDVMIVCSAINRSGTAKNKVRVVLERCGHAILKARRRRKRK